MIRVHNNKSIFHMAVTVHKTPALATGVGVHFKWVFRTTAQVSLSLRQSAPHYVSSRPCCLLVPFNCWDLSAFQHVEGFLVNSQTTGPRNKKALIYGSSDKHAPGRKCRIKDLCKIPYLLLWRTRVSFFFFNKRMQEHYVQDDFAECFIKNLKI